MFWVANLNVTMEALKGVQVQPKIFKDAPAKYRSKVWGHFGFSVADGKKVVCKHCLQDIPYSGGTTNLYTHVRRHHPELGEVKLEPGILFPLNYFFFSNNCKHCRCILFYEKPIAFHVPMHFNKYALLITVLKIVKNTLNIS